MSEETEVEVEVEDKKELRMSLRDFVSKGYTKSSWEIVDTDEFITNEFFPIDLEILEGEVLGDSFFEDFTVKNARAQQKKIAQAKFVSIDVHEKLLKESFEQGIEEGKLLATASQAETKVNEEKRYQILQQKVLTEHLKVIEELEKKSAELALQISKKILRQTAELKPEYILDIVKKGLASIGAATPLKIRFSQEDYDFIDIVGVPPEISKEELGIEFVVDPHIQTGCVIETNYGEIDLQLDSMWEQISQKISEVIK